MPGAVQILVTKQTGPAGKPVNTLYIANKMKLKNEMYFALLLDRGTMGPMIIACSEGDPPLSSCKGTDGHLRWPSRSPRVSHINPCTC